MRLILLFIILFIHWSQCVSQKIIVADSVTKTPLVFVSIKYSDGGLYTNEKGWFYRDAVTAETIELSSLGYKTRQIQTSIIKDTIFLVFEPTPLDEVTVIKHDNKKELAYKRPKSTNYNGSTTLLSKNKLFLVLIPEGLSGDTYINDITFYFNKKIEIQNDKKEVLKTVDGFVRFNIYTVVDEKPSTHIYASEPIKVSSFKKDEVVLNLSNEMIAIPKKGICISLEMIGYYDKEYNEVSGESYVRPMLTPQKYKHFKAVTYKNLSFTVNNSDNNLMLMTDFLKHLGVTNPKHTDRNLAVGLTLSNYPD